MAGFLKKVFSNAVVKPSAEPSRQSRLTSNSSEPIDVAKLTELLRYFPLAEKIRYYVEHQKDAVLDTIILGYGVNNKLVYSSIDIRCQQKGEREVVSINADGKETIADEIESFCFVIPCNKEDENKRDYVRKAELGPSGPFRRNNTITLVAYSASGVLSHVDTVVRKVMPLKSGIYAGHEVVLLDVLPDTLTLSDQRQHFRLQTNIPATLSVRDGNSHDCMLVDFSENSVQLAFDEANDELQSLSRARHLALKIDLGTNGQKKEYILSGVMYRNTSASMVMTLKGIYKDDTFETIGLVEILEIKANLLQHPATQQILMTE